MMKNVRMFQPKHADVLLFVWAYRNSEKFTLP